MHTIFPPFYYVTALPVVFLRHSVVCLLALFCIELDDKQFDLLRWQSADSVLTNRRSLLKLLLVCLCTIC